MDKNFKVRASVSVAMFTIALITLYIKDGLPFKLIFALFAIIAIIELFSFFKKKSGTFNTILAIVEVVFIVWGTIYVASISVSNFWYIILGVPGYDIFAYLFGKLLGGKIFGKSRPFPHISKNKTWEGTIMGLVMAIGMVAILLVARGDFATNWFYLFCGPLALIGDLFESFLKRKFDVKDSNEILIKKPLFEKLEIFVGGSEGHGGFLDRIDSTVFACAVFLIVSSLL